MIFYIELFFSIYYLGAFLGLFRYRGCGTFVLICLVFCYLPHLRGNEADFILELLYARDRGRKQPAIRGIPLLLLRINSRMKSDSP